MVPERTSSLLVAINGVDEALCHLTAQLRSQGPRSRPEQPALKRLVASHAELTNVLQSMEEEQSPDRFSSTLVCAPSLVHQLFGGSRLGGIASEVCSWLGMEAHAALQVCCKEMNDCGIMPWVPSHGVKLIRPSVLSCAAVLQHGAELAVSWGSPREAEDLLSRHQEGANVFKLAANQRGPPVTICVTALLETVRARRLSENGIALALRILQFLLQNFPEARSSARMVGGVHLMLDILASCWKDTIQVEGAACLAMMSKNPEVAQDIVQHGGIPILVKALEKTPLREAHGTTCTTRDVRVAEPLAEHMLHALAWTLTCATAGAYDAKLLPFLIRATSSPNKMLRHQGMHALSNLLASYPQGCVDFLERGGVQSVVAALSDESTFVVVRAALTLAHACVEDGGASVILAAGALTLLLKLLDHPEVDVTAAASLAVASLVHKDSASAGDIRRAGGIPLLHALTQGKLSEKRFVWKQCQSAQLRALLGLSDKGHGPQQHPAALALQTMASIGDQSAATIQSIASASLDMRVGKRPAVDMASANPKRKASIDSQSAAIIQSPSASVPAVVRVGKRPASHMGSAIVKRQAT